MLKIFRKPNCSNELGNLDLSEFRLELLNVLLLLKKERWELLVGISRKSTRLTR
jgi:hypothetical protein